MLQWGEYTTTISKTWKTIIMSVSFRNASYVIIGSGSANDNATGSGLSVATGRGSKQKSSSSFAVGSEGIYAGLFWFAIGTYT